MANDLTLLELLNTTDNIFGNDTLSTAAGPKVFVIGNFHGVLAITESTATNATIDNANQNITSTTAIPLIHTQLALNPGVWLGITVAVLLILAACRGLVLRKVSHSRIIRKIKQRLPFARRDSLPRPSSRRILPILTEQDMLRIQELTHRSSANRHVPLVNQPSTPSTPVDAGEISSASADGDSGYPVSIASSQDSSCITPTGNDRMLLDADGRTYNHITKVPIYPLHDFASGSSRILGTSPTGAVFWVHDVSSNSTTKL